MTAPPTISAALEAIKAAPAQKAKDTYPREDPRIANARILMSSTVHRKHHNRILHLALFL